MVSALVDEIQRIKGVVEDGLLDLFRVFLEDRYFFIELAQSAVPELICLSDVWRHVSVWTFCVRDERCQEAVVAGGGKAEHLLAIVVGFEDLDGVGYRGIGFKVLR